MQSTRANGNGNGHVTWSDWPSAEAFRRVKDKLDDAVLELDMLHHRLNGEIVPPVSAEQVSDLAAFAAWADLDLRILRGKVDELSEVRRVWQSWLVTPRDYYRPAS